MPTPSRNGPIKAIADQRLWRLLTARSCWAIVGGCGNNLKNGCFFLLGPFSLLVSDATKQRDKIATTNPVGARSRQSIHARKFHTFFCPTTSQFTSHIGTTHIGTVMVRAYNITRIMTTAKLPLCLWQCNRRHKRRMCALAVKYYKKKMWFRGCYSVEKWKEKSGCLTIPTASSWDSEVLLRSRNWSH